MSYQKWTLFGGGEIKFYLSSYKVWIGSVMELSHLNEDIYYIRFAVVRFEIVFIRNYYVI